MTEIDCTGITGGQMTREVLRFDPSEIASFVLIDNNLVIGRLSGIVLPRGMHSRRGNRMHLRLRNMLGHNRNIELPDEKLLIIGAGDKFILFDEGYCIHCAQMLVVLHLFLACV